MTFTLEEVAAIVQETVSETVKDLKNVAEIIRLTAMVTQELKDVLTHDPEIRIDKDTSRGGLTREKAIAWQCAVTLKERAA